MNVIELRDKLNKLIDAGKAQDKLLSPEECYYCSVDGVTLAKSSTGSVVLLERCNNYVHNYQHSDILEFLNTNKYTVEEI